MPYKVVHVFSEENAELLNENKSCIDYDDLSALLDDGWEVEDTKDTEFKGVSCERYRLKKGPEERGLARRQDTGVMSADGHERGDMLPGEAGLMPQAGSVAAEIARALSGAFHHLGASSAGQLGVPVVSGNSHMIIGQAAADAVYQGRGEEACPYSDGSLGHRYWMDAFEGVRKVWEDQHGGHKHPSRS